MSLLGFLKVVVDAVLEKVREQLAARRSAGAPFDLAWRAVVPDDPEWSEVLDATRHGWRAAYERRPVTLAELALRVVGEDPERTVPVDELLVDAIGQRLCARCSGPIPAGKRPQARYCSHRCQRAANGRAVAA